MTPRDRLFPQHRKWVNGPVYIEQRPDGQFYGTLTEKDSSRESLFRLRALIDAVIEDTKEEFA